MSIHFDASNFYFDESSLKSLSYKYDDVVLQTETNARIQEISFTKLNIGNNILREINAPKLSRVDGSVEVKVTYEWGGESDGKFSAEINADIRDDHGNYISGEYTKDDEGKNSVSVSAGHKESADH